MTFEIYFGLVFKHACIPCQVFVKHRNAEAVSMEAALFFI